MKALSTILALAFTLGVGAPAFASETDELWASGTKALAEGRPGDAIAAFEALADRGVVDAALSFDRGLAYVERVRLGAEAPGDLGRAAHGFEEARELSTSPELSTDAANALALVRSEVARRRAHAGDPVDLDQGRSLGRAVAHLLSEDVWAALALVASLALGIGLTLRTFPEGRRAHIAGTITSVLSATVLAVCVGLTWTLRHERVAVREAVIVTSSARPADDRGITLPGASVVPEGARVEVEESKPGWVRIRWGTVRGWIPVGAARPLAKGG